MAQVRVAIITVPRDEAKSLAKGIIEERLGACVNILPKIESLYWWENKVQTEEESILMVKSIEAKVGLLVDYVKENHPYEIPEIIVLPLTEGLPEYINWVMDAMATGSE
jgi:periplasmic divalent cation tolerance protein